MAKRTRVKTVKPESVARPTNWARSQTLTAATVLILGLLGGLVFLELNNGGHFPLQKVKVYGEFRHIQAKQIYEKVSATVDAPDFFSVDSAAVRDTIKSMPWVKEVSVRKVWPHTLALHIKEQRPVARWGKNKLVNSSGQLFVHETNEDFNLPVFLGPKGNESLMYAKYSSVQQSLAKLDQSIMKLVLDERRAWTLVLKNGLKLNIGRDFSQAKIERFIKHYNKLFTTRSANIAVLDLRYTNGFSVKWKKKPESVVQGPDNVKES